MDGLPHWRGIVSLLRRFKLGNDWSQPLHALDLPRGPHHLALTVFLYLLAVLSHRDGIFDTHQFFNNLYFLLLTGVICVTTAYFTAGRRFEDFRLRHELDSKNSQLAESYDRLAEADRMKSDFFANINHELRTPLTLIISPVEDLLNSGKIPIEAREPLEIARKNALRLLHLINNILEIVRLEEGGSDFKRENVDLALFIPAMIDSIRHLATLKGITLQIQPDPEPLMVSADRGGLERVAVNVLTNALKFTPRGGTITTRLRRENNHAIVEFQDTGIGISPQDLPFIFDRFRQAAESSSRQFHGVGIGLALARQMVEEHGGHLTVSSELGKGTTMRMELPLSKSPIATPPKPATDENDPIAKIYREAEREVQIGAAPSGLDLPVAGHGGHRILVVDDEHDMRRFLVSTLAEEHTVHQAADGESALRKTRECRPELIVLDLMLPGIDGLEICRRLKTDESTRTIKIVLLTARTDEADKIAALERGADDFLTKPFSTTELKTRLNNLLQAAALEDRLRERNLELESLLAKLKETEVQLVQSEKMSALGKLSAGLLHEINNPLNYTFTALQVAEDLISGPHESSLKEILTDIGQGMGRIRDVVSDLRTFAYPSKEATREPFLLADALTSALRLISHELKGTHVDHAQIDGQRVLGSKTQIIHVLMNLLMNSAHALHQHPTGRTPQIRLITTQINERLTIAVWDNGAGIRAEDLPAVFDPFFTTKDVGQGMGLGLSICHTIIRNHGGKITARSEYGVFTEVAFDLALASQE